MRSLAGFVGLVLLCVGCSGKTVGGGPMRGSDGSGASGNAGPMAGTSGTSSSQGGSAAIPTTGNVFVDQISQSAVDKVDLLFMIDNSVSMGDKEKILTASVPVLLGRLASPACVDAKGVPTGGSAQADGSCAAPGSAPEFPPISDIHLGIVSSSLGAHGGTVCSAPVAGDDPTITHLDDKGHLIGSVRTGLTSWNNSGFLAWDPAGIANTPPGESSFSNLATNFSAMVEATGEHGCAYEASLEAWYRFLIDPEPPATVSKVNNTTLRQGIDMDLLAQRAAFLRPDSLVAIVMLTDENDCSIRDDGVGWFVGATSHMPKATAQCAADPNDPCCRSCAQNEVSPPSGCAALAADPVCMGAPAGSYNTWDSLNDSLNLRCFNQKARFGFDLLYETSRYVNALTSPTLTLQSNASTTVVNPLYDNRATGSPPRDPSLVFLAGIVGVPWQDIATADSLISPTALTFLTATELVAQNRWTQLLGDPTANPPVPPSDPFMVEQIGPRAGANPNVSAFIVPPSSLNPTTSVINGHEHNVPDNSDLQYACTFKLATPKVCAPGDSACDCASTKAGDTSAIVAANSPLCQPPGGGPPSTTQYFAKAYPGARELTVLKGFGDNAIVASICPKVTTAATADPSQDPSYGYNPAMAAIVNRLKEAFKQKCLPRALAHADDENGNPTKSIACGIVEAQPAGHCNCAEAGHSAVDPTLASAVFTQLKASGACGTAAGVPTCDATGFCMCQINQETGANLAACQANGAPSVPGFCYIDDPASPDLANCPSNEKQILRFVGNADIEIPAQGATTFIACQGGTP